MLIDLDDHYDDCSIACDYEPHSRQFENLTVYVTKNHVTFATPAQS
jgi:hypothetical protein